MDEKMRLKGIRRRCEKLRCLGKKAFISDVLVDFYSYIVFALVIIVFAVFYTWNAKSSMQALEGERDVVYGNYLSQVYLRTPIVVSGNHMSLAELISIYDYNQTLEKEKDQSYAEWVENDILFVFGKPNPMQEALVDITDDFVEKNFDHDKCFIFSIVGASFEINRFSSECFGGFLSARNLMEMLEGVPEEIYMTYVASVDPRQEPVVVYCVYDLEKLVSVYEPHEYFELSDVSERTHEELCSENPDECA